MDGRRGETMTSLLPKPYYSEFDNIFEIKKILKKEHYQKPFCFLYDWFFVEKQNAVTVTHLQQAVLIPNCGRAYQILTSFVHLNLLIKVKVDGRKDMVFRPKNKEWWQDEKKELEKKGDNSGSERTDTGV